MKQSKLSKKQKIEKELPEFVAEVAGLSVQDLDARLAQLAKDIQQVKDSRDADEDLQSLRDQVKLASAPYSDAKKVLQQKTSYIIELLKSGA